MKKTDFVREVYEENKISQHPVGYSIISRVFSIARSSFSYTSKRETKDQQEKQRLEVLHKEHPWYGHRRIGWTLGWSLRKTRRLMQKFHISAVIQKQKRFVKKGDQKQGDLHGKYIGGVKIVNHLKSICPLHPYVIWRSDFTHVIYQGVHLYLATVLDDFTKEIVGYALSYSHSKELVLTAIQDAIQKTGGVLPEYFHSDQGSEYTSESVMAFLIRNHIAISMSSKGSPWQNGAQESYYGKFKLELGETKQYPTREELILAIHRQIQYYNTRRMHTALRDTPRGFREKHEERQKLLEQKSLEQKSLEQKSLILLE